MKGLEELTKKNYIDPDKPSKLKPDDFSEDYSFLNIGATTFSVLSKYLDIDYEEATDFVPVYWKKPKNLKSTRPDGLLTKGNSIIAVVENKSPGEIKGKKNREAALEQLHCYCLIP